MPPPNHASLLAQEQAWRVDINDGVRVNAAPLQATGLLANDVLAAKDLPKAIAGRVLAIRRATLGARRQAALLWVDGRGCAGESRVDGPRARAGEGAGAAEGEAAEGGGGT